uniref:Uncharacterized protein n=1 Tax=Daphnia galeata TaxID=27404 RepID=A0A8J2RZF1_9CRUS|nr:unnamed protein product [Daphnia galeata]
MKLSPYIFFCAVVGTVLMADISMRNRRGLPGVSLKDLNPNTFTSFSQQYFRPRPSFGDYGGNYKNNYGVNSYSVGTYGYGGYGSNYGSQFGYTNYGAGTYGVGSYSTVSSSASGGGAYGK